MAEAVATKPFLLKRHLGLFNQLRWHWLPLFLRRPLQKTGKELSLVVAAFVLNWRTPVNLELYSMGRKLYIGYRWPKPIFWCYHYNIYNTPHNRRHCVGFASGGAQGLCTACIVQTCRRQSEPENHAVTCRCTVWSLYEGSTECKSTFLRCKDGWKAVADSQLPTNLEWSLRIGTMKKKKGKDKYPCTICTAKKACNAPHVSTLPLGSDWLLSKLKTKSKWALKPQAFWQVACFVGQSSRYQCRRCNTYKKTPAQIAKVSRSYQSK